MHGFQAVCHQLPDRSFAVGGVPLALCHRCTGIAAGLVAGVFAVPLLGRGRRLLVRFERPLLMLALLLLAADWLLGVGGLWANTAATRFGTGFLFGVAAGYLLARSVAVPVALPPSRILPSTAPAP